VIFGGIAENFEQFSDGCVQFFKIDKRIFLPESLMKHLTAYQISFLLQQGN
jgi:hypothetical protein